MLLTPPDVISQSLLAVPMWLLFEMGIFFSRFFVRESGDEDEDDGREHEPRPTPGPTAGKGPGSAPRPEPTPPPRPPGHDAVAAVAAASQGTGFRPMTEEEMDAELDRIEEEEAAQQTADKPGTGQSSGAGSGDAGTAAKLERVMALREQGNEAPARALLYEVLREGDADQVMVARNILKQLDEDA
jgi:sec-independent protein translocase protein TatC